MKINVIINVVYFFSVAGECFDYAIDYFVEKLDRLVKKRQFHTVYYLIYNKQFIFTICVKKVQPLQ